MCSNRRQERRLAGFIGDFSILRNFLSKKRNNSPWIILKSFDALLRGFGQVVFANNPISGLMISGALIFFAPGLMLLASGSGILGLFLSLLIGEPKSHIENGLTVFNPFLCGALTHALTPDIYETFDSRLFVYFLITIVFSVYLTRAFGSGKLPGLSIPFNIVQLIFIFTLSSTSNNFLHESNNTTIKSHGSTAGHNSFPENADPIISDGTSANLDWGMVFRGMVTSASQVFAVDNVAVSSIIYLAILTYSPITAAFSFAGAMLGSLTSIVLDVPIEETYCGLWGYNGLLTCAALGGFFLVIGIQTTFAAVLAGIFVTILQNCLTPLFAQAGLPVLSVPFVLTTWLFLGLRGSAGSSFLEPENYSFPEQHRWDYIESQRETIISSHRQSGASNELDSFTAERQPFK